MSAEQSLFRCPYCCAALVKDGRAWHCKNGHNFDIAAQGYTNLLGVQKKHTKDPGDSTEMVAARAEFLRAGYYDIFREKLAQLVCEACGAKPSPYIVDAGCGEGAYTRAVAQYLQQAGKAPHIAAFDIAKSAVKSAAKQGGHGIEYAVAGCFDMPVADGCADVLTDVFSPLAAKEFARVLKKDGVFIFAVPGPRHLFGLKEILYDNPYENRTQDTAYDGFAFVKRCSVQGFIHVQGRQIENLFSMTPYYWRTPREGAQRLAQQTQLDTEIQFDFLLYKKLF